MHGTPHVDVTWHPPNLAPAHAVPSRPVACLPINHHASPALCRLLLPLDPCLLSTLDLLGGTPRLVFLLGLQEVAQGGARPMFGLMGKPWVRARRAAETAMHRVQINECTGVGPPP